MIRRTIRWLVSWFGLRRLRSEGRLVRKAARELRRAERQLNWFQIRIETDRDMLEEFADSAAERLNEAIEAVERAEVARKSYEEAMSAMTGQLQVMEEVTIPTLVASHNVLLERYRAEVAIQVRRQVGSVGSVHQD